VFYVEHGTNSAVAAVDLKDMRLFAKPAMWMGSGCRRRTAARWVWIIPPAAKLSVESKLSGAETRHAIEVANEAFKSWSARTAKERANVLRKWFDLMMENQEDLARLMTLEQGSR